MIALLGNPFSPAYALARRNFGTAPALPYSSMNVALYGRRGSRFSMFEQPVRSSHRSATHLAMGPSAMRWEGDRLIVSIDERTTPLSRPVRGTIVLHPEARSGLEVDIDGDGHHRWWPVAPLARIEASFLEPNVTFSGHGYFDANAGDVPLETSFESWSWSRARTEEGALLTYDVACTNADDQSLAFRVSKSGAVDELERSWKTPLRRTKFGLARHARVDHGERARVVRSLEDGPFYARSLVETKLGGRPVVAMHETLAAHRLKRSWVQFCVGWRMRRFF